ncbi:MAG: hypothetical protein JNK82_02990 [Myxococcaceae bacterium]|nr:hypothetical protein [Myxococcaceae bacterium]
MRSILLPVLLSAVSSSAATLTVGGDLRYTLADPAQRGDVTGRGSVTLTCSPCSTPGNSVWFGFESVGFVYVNAPGERPNRASGVEKARESHWDFETRNRFPAGARLYPILNNAVCVCGNNAESSMATDFPRPDLAFTTDPKLTVLTSWGSPEFKDLTVGKPHTLHAQCDAHPKQGEHAVLEVHGPGIDLRHTFTDSSDGQLQVEVTPSAVGTVEAWCTFEPYGNTSNVLTLPVVAPKGSGPSKGSGRDEAEGEAPAGGCSATGAPALLLLAAVSLARRRSRA